MPSRSSGGTLCWLASRSLSYSVAGSTWLSSASFSASWPRVMAGSVRSWVNASMAVPMSANTNRIVPVRSAFFRAA